MSWSALLQVQRCSLTGGAWSETAGRRAARMASCPLLSIRPVAASTSPRPPMASRDAQLAATHGIHVHEAKTSEPMSVSALSNLQGAPGVSPVLLGSFHHILEHYFDRCPTAGKSIEVAARGQPASSPLYFDHFACRTFGVEGFGIESLARPLLDLGYTEHEDRLEFEQKKLQARWFVPPEADFVTDFPLPRVFVSEIEVEKLTDRAQMAIRQYTSSETARGGAKHGLLAAACNSLPWRVPSKEDWELLAAESEYAAWVLVNGYALNHTTLTVHRFESAHQTVLEWNEVIKAEGIVLNSSGGEEKVSPDGGLRQSSTLSDNVMFKFANGEECEVPGPYIEFAERRVLPEFQSLPPQQVRERHRREGFEAASADKIFESTSATQ